MLEMMTLTLILNASGLFPSLPVPEQISLFPGCIHCDNLMMMVKRTMKEAALGLSLVHQRGSAVALMWEGS